MLALPPAPLAGFSIPQPPRLTVEPGAVFEQSRGDSKDQAAILLAGGLANLAWMAAGQRLEQFCSPCCVSMAPLVCQLELIGSHLYVELKWEIFSLPLPYLCLTFALPSLPRRESARVSPQPGCESGYSHPAHMTLSTYP